MEWRKGRLGRHRAGLGQENRNQVMEKRPAVKLRNSALTLKDEHIEDGEEAMYSECDLIRSFHLFNPDFSLAQLGLTVTLEFSAPVTGWETEKQPWASRERTRLVAAGYWEFPSCLGMTTLLSSKGKLNLLIKFLLGDLSMYLFVQTQQIRRAIALHDCASVFALCCI